ncbi:hypothetical protein RQCS_62540 (plasmid) [Rhodococcus qingshengii]|nr:hypothetical protein RQCS_62540 [Rhodococcus qingshengii]
MLVTATCTFTLEVCSGSVAICNNKIVDRVGRLEFNLRRLLTRAILECQDGTSDKPKDCHYGRHTTPVGTTSLVRLAASVLHSAFVPARHNRECRRSDAGHRANVDYLPFVSQTVKFAAKDSGAQISAISG